MAFTSGNQKFLFLEESETKVSKLPNFGRFKVSKEIMHRQGEGVEELSLSEVGLITTITLTLSNIYVLPDLELLICVVTAT